MTFLQLNFFIFASFLTLSYASWTANFLLSARSCTYRHLTEWVGWLLQYVAAVLDVAASPSELIQVIEENVIKLPLESAVS